MSGDRVPLTIPPELDVEMTPGVRAFVELLLGRIEALEAEVDELKIELAAVKKTPRNSSLPPSSEHPHAKPMPEKPKSPRKQGGQHGHPKHERVLIPTADCQQMIPCKPTHCRGCGHKLTGNDPDPWRHQVWDVPQIKPLVTEYQRHRLTCACCGETTCGVLPDGVPRGQGGPRLIALVALLMGSFRQSKRRVALFLEQVLNQPCSSGWVVKLQQQATTALRPAYAELVQQLPAQDVLGIDESPTREGRVKAWLWTCVAQRFTAFALRTTRAATVLDELLTADFNGAVTCDRAKMYLHLPRLQWCWAHLKRDFQALVDSDDHQAQRLGRDLMRPTKELFRHWSRCRDGTITRAGFKRLMTPIRQELEALQLRGEFSGNPEFAGMCRELYEHRQWLWTFLEVEGIEPTNNASERALRHAVIWRKLSFGTQSSHGSRFVETLLTIVETCRQQSRSVFEFIANTVEAHFAQKPTPSMAEV